MAEGCFFCYCDQTRAFILCNRTTTVLDSSTKSLIGYLLHMDKSWSEDPDEMLSPGRAEIKGKG